MIENLETSIPWARYMPERSDSVDETAELIARAIAYCYERGIPRLLVDAVKLPGFPPEMLTSIERFLMVMGWAEESHGRVVVAIVTKPRYIDPGKLGVTVARNAGMRADIFASEPDAMRFLQDPYSTPKE